MAAGYRGSFVTTWAATSIDGVTDAPVSALRGGAEWSWRGEVMQVDGPNSILRLSDAVLATDVRPRAARMIERLVRLPSAAPAPDTPIEEDLPTRSFIVTDGLRSYTICAIDKGARGSGLVLFQDEIPPQNRELWVVRHSFADADERPRTVRSGTVAGFAAGTMIATPYGEVVIEALREGDPVMTRDHGAQPILWMSKRHVSGARLYLEPHLRPFRISKDGPYRGLGSRSIHLSRGQRLLLTGDEVQALFNTPEVFAAVRDLEDGHLVRPDFGLRNITYRHILLPQHAVIRANGWDIESFEPSVDNLVGLGDEDRIRLMQHLPEETGPSRGYAAPARRVLTHAETTILRRQIR